MSTSENPTGADNQQGSRRATAQSARLTPQRLHAELLGASAEQLEAYLQGAVKDGTFSFAHNTHRIGQSDPQWIELLKLAIERLGHRSWTYREGSDREYWVIETSADFLDVAFDASVLDDRSAIFYVRGFFDAEGGMPRNLDARLYFQFVQKDWSCLDVVKSLLTRLGIRTGRIHNPSVRVDPEYWRFYVAAASFQDFMETISSWHPRKRMQIETRMKI